MALTTTRPFSLRLEFLIGFFVFVTLAMLLTLLIFCRGGGWGRALGPLASPALSMLSLQAPFQFLPRSSGPAQSPAGTTQATAPSPALQ